MTRRFATIVLLAAALTTGAATASSGGGQATPDGDITVSAASSLTEAFEQIREDFQEGYDGTTVTFNFGSSSTLEAQLEQGAPADVFASADTANMQKLAGAGGVRGRPVVFARNRLQIAVEPGNPKRIKGLADTLAEDVQLVLCAAEVPCGKYAAEAYAKAGLEVPEVPTGLTAKDTLSKVALGEADAAVVYVTDVKAAKGDVRGVAIPDRDNVVARYPIAVVSASENVATAKAFVRYVTSTRGQKTLRSFGFLAP
jgi:molybdate transport system substrate-binding protein